MSEPLAPKYVEGDPRSLTLLDKNARYMTHEQYMRLVGNIRADGALTSTPLVWNDVPNNRRIVLSGNHRTKASIDAGLKVIGWLEITQPLPRQRRIAMQLSHNAVEGQDDPATLKELFNELEDVATREYAGLDDKTLDLLESVNVESLNEADLDWASVQIVFLPTEKEAADKALEQARAAASVDERWLAAIGQYEATLDALETAKAAHNIGNIATALGVVLAVFENHLGELREGWYDTTTGEPKHTGRVPIETLLGTRTMPADAAAVIAQAIDKALKADDVSPDALWRLLELWAADYLAG